jgi:hypothetical protein
MSFEHTFLPDLEWSRIVADAVVNDLLVANVISLDQADSTTEIVTQQIHLKLVSGLRPRDELQP